MDKFSGAIIVKMARLRNSGTRASGLNSPFVVTVLGGVFLTIISGVLTFVTGYMAKEREAALQKLKQKQEFVDTFCSRIDRQMQLTVEMRQREIFIKGWQDATERDKVQYPNGKTYLETCQIRECEKRYYFERSSAPPTGFIYTAKILFPSGKTSAALDDLNQALLEYFDAESDDVLLVAYRKAIVSLERRAAAMAAESHEHKYEYIGDDISLGFNLVRRLLVRARQ